MEQHENSETEQESPPPSSSGPVSPATTFPNDAVKLAERQILVVNCGGEWRTPVKMFVITHENVSFYTPPVSARLILIHSLRDSKWDSYRLSAFEIGSRRRNVVAELQCFLNPHLLVEGEGGGGGGWKETELNVERRKESAEVKLKEKDEELEILFYCHFRCNYTYGIKKHVVHNLSGWSLIYLFVYFYVIFFIAFSIGVVSSFVICQSHSNIF